MTATTLIESFASRGFTVLADGDAIKVSPSSALTDDDRQEIRDNKAELLAALRSEPHADDSAEVEEVCPICHGALREQRGKRYRHVWCPTPGHFDSWRADGRRKLSETDAPIIREREKQMDSTQT